MRAYSFDLPHGMCAMDVARAIGAHFANTTPEDPKVVVTKHGDRYYLGEMLEGLFLRFAGARASLNGELSTEEFEEALRSLKKPTPDGSPNKKVRTSRTTHKVH